MRWRQAAERPKPLKPSTAVGVPGEVAPTQEDRKLGTSIEREKKGSLRTRNIPLEHLGTDVLIDIVIKVCQKSTIFGYKGSPRNLIQVVSCAFRFPLAEEDGCEVRNKQLCTGSTIVFKQNSVFRLKLEESDNSGVLFFYLSIHDHTPKYRMN